MFKNILLAVDFAKQDFKQRYVGTNLGQLWFILAPLITILIYTIVFSDLMKARLNIIDNTYSYSIYLIPGILAWLSFSSILRRLTTSIQSKANLIKKINVPIYVFQLSIVIAEFIPFIISMILGITFLLAVNHPVNLTFFWLLPVMVLQTIFVFALGVILSLFVPFFKDLKEAIPIIIQLWFWMTPIIYMKEILEKKVPILLSINPFYYFVDIYHNVFLFSRAPDLKGLLSVSIVTFIALILSAFLYKKMVSSIKDII